MLDVCFGSFRHGNFPSCFFFFFSRLGLSGVSNVRLVCFFFFLPSRAFSYGFPFFFFSLLPLLCVSPTFPTHRSRVSCVSFVCFARTAAVVGSRTGVGSDPLPSLSRPLRFPPPRLPWLLRGSPRSPTTSPGRTSSRLDSSTCNDDAPTTPPPPPPRPTRHWHPPSLPLCSPATVLRDLDLPGCSAWTRGARGKGRGRRGPSVLGGGREGEGPQRSTGRGRNVGYTGTQANPWRCGADDDGQDARLHVHDGAGVGEEARGVEEERIHVREEQDVDGKGKEKRPCRCERMRHVCVWEEN